MAPETVGWCLQQQISPRSATSSAQPIIWQVLLVSVLHGVHSLERCKARQAERRVSVSWERCRAVMALRVSVTVLWVRERRQRLANCWPANAFCGIFWDPTTVSVLLEVRKGRFFFPNTVDAKIRVDLQLSLTPPVRYRLPFSMIHTKLFMLSVF